MSYNASGPRGRGFAQTVRVLSYGGGRIWPNLHINFIVAEKAYFTVPLALFSVYVGGDSKRHMGGGVGRKRQNSVIWWEGV